MSREQLCAFAVLALVVFAMPLDATAEPPGKEATDKIDDHEKAELSAELPADVNLHSKIKGDFTLETFQHDFDRFSWKSFIALNSPTLLDGSPATTRIGQEQDNLPSWQFWKEDHEVFVEPGDEPSAWGTTRRPPGHLSVESRQLFIELQKELAAIGKPLRVLEASVEPFDSGPLIDQNGAYARFEILVNKPMFNLIVDNKLYSKAGQAALRGNVVFPCGDGKRQQESIMIKAAWKVLSEHEKQSGRFHTSRAFLCSRSSSASRVSERCSRATVGLVGLHIVHKTPSRPQWIWSTFEHVDNCPVDGEAEDARQFNFFTKESAVKENQPPLPPWDPTVSEPPERRSKIKRMIAITPDARALNTEYQALLGNSVWSHYQLISTQWPANASKDCDVKKGAPVDVAGLPAPQFLGNSTLESYLPGKVVNVSSSCMECHANATGTNGRFSDFTFLLLRAK